MVPDARDTAGAEAAHAGPSQADSAATDTARTDAARTDAAEAAQADRALFGALVTEVPFGVAFLDDRLRLRRVNAALRALLRDGGAGEGGRDGADLTGRTLTEVLDGEFAAALEPALRGVLDDGRPVTGLEVRGPVPETGAAPAAPSGAAQEPGGASEPGGAGERVWVCACLPVRGPGGAALGAALIVQDETVRRAVEEAITRRTERYRSLVEATTPVVWTTAADGSAGEDAPHWRAVTGQTPEDYAEGGWLAAVHPEDYDRVAAEWRDCMRGGRVLEVDCRVLTGAGGRRHFEVRAVPIRRDGEVIEWVCAGTDVTGRRDAEEMRGRLTGQLSAAALRTARLQQATSMLAEALTVGEVVRVIVEVGQSAVGVDHCTVALLDDGKAWLTPIAPAADPSNTAAPATEDDEEFEEAEESGAGPGALPVWPDVVAVTDPTVMSAAAREGRPFVAENPGELRRMLGEAAAEHEMRRGPGEQAWVALPLLAAGAAIGVLRFAFTRTRFLTEDEQVFLEALAGQCALAVERAILFEREHRTAEQLQRSLLPGDLPSSPELRMAARYDPVTRHVQVGGDWYDVFKLPGNRLAVVVGDVMGKGVLAAAIMGRVRNALRALALTDPRPAAVLSGLDRLFSATEDAEQFTTVAYLVIDPATGQGLYTSAGHPPPLLLPAGRPPELSDVEAGTPLGWPSHRQQASFSLSPGDTVVLYSDGLVENRRRGVDTGLSDLVAAAAELPRGGGADPARLVDHLVARLLAGYEQSDDVTLLALHVPAAEDVPTGEHVPAVRE
ncbi:SpoIIE family protein phosphatase [Actinomadura opuntiae]|uniref:SpoIIE family protein phosphatase n=1 Tax=Actinomadura sp. OS1-43 TaxID=604315 RepID=UPI00255ACD9C|nr:SpoIIE family protein phosphatase [Actinomadura sp. OS1-43]MDL4819784.1 SpoIIE family protein phosphatase [Actinomadura sp. OS1-43]